MLENYFTMAEKLTMQKNMKGLEILKLEVKCNFHEEDTIRATNKIIESTEICI